MVQDFYWQDILDVKSTALKTRKDGHQYKHCFGIYFYFHRFFQS